MKNRWLHHSLVAAVIAYLWAPTVSNLWKARTGQGPATEPLPTKTSSAKPLTLPPLEQYAVVSERNLFGGSGENAAPEEKTSIESTPTAQQGLGLRLVGTVVTDDSKLNLAFIENQKTRKQESYREGDRVENVTVKKVVRNNVIILTQRGDELLTVKPGEEEARGGPTAGSAARPQPRSTGPQADQGARQARRYSPSSPSPVSAGTLAPGSAARVVGTPPPERAMQAGEGNAGSSPPPAEQGESSGETNPFAEAIKQSIEKNKQEGDKRPTNNPFDRVIRRAAGN